MTTGSIDKNVDSVYERESISWNNQDNEMLDIALKETFSKSADIPEVGVLREVIIEVIRGSGGD